MAFRLLTIVFSLFTGLALSAQPDAIDRSFGVDGYAADDKLTDRDVATILRLKDSSIMLIGTRYNKGGGWDYGTVSKYSKDGQIDTRFGYSGVYNYGLAGNSNVTFSDAVLTENDELVVTGYTFNYTQNTGGQFLLKIKTSDGSVDSTFGKDGLLIIDNVNLLKLDLFKIDSNGSFLMCFLQKAGTEGSNYNFSKVYKFGTGGIIDSAFMKRAYGRVNQAVPTIIHDILITKDNHYWLAYRYANSGNISLEAYDSNGILFKAPVNGKIYYGLPSPYFLNSFKLLQASDTSFYTCINFGKNVNSNLNQFTGGVQFYHYNLKGELIRSFGKNGFITHQLSNKLSIGWHVFLRDNARRIIFANNVADTTIDGNRGYPITISNASIYRFLPNGFPDSSFNNFGIFNDFRDKEADDGLRGVLICNDDRIIAAGFSVWDQKDVRQFLCRLKTSSPVHHSGIQKVKKYNVHVYPIPFSDHLYLDGSIGTCHYTFFDMKGAIVKEGITQNGSINALEDMPAGVYMLRLNKAQSFPEYLRVIKE